MKPNPMERLINGIVKENPTFVLMLGAIFMATDYVTSPITKNGKIIYAIVLGILTGLFRLFGPMAEGVSYSIIIANLLVPLIERVTVPTPFGIVKKGGKSNE